MRYAQLESSGQYPYPSHSIDPKNKGAAWCLAYAKAAYYDWQHGSQKGVFAANGGDYERFRMYALGKQPVDQYKKLLGVDMKTDTSWTAIDWRVRGVAATYRDKAISRLMDNESSIIATPVDMQAQADLQHYYAEIKAKMAVRQLMQQQDPELANHPLIAPKPGEPLDQEELEMRAELGEQFNRSKDAELAIQLGFYENNYTHFRRSLYEDLFDYGVAGYKEWLGPDGKAKFRKVDPNCVIVSTCRESNFSDAIHAGEEIEVPLVELATLTNTDKEGNEVPVFTPAELEEFAQSIAGQWNNPRQIGTDLTGRRTLNRFKCRVLDLEFKTYDEHVWRDAPDAHGNPDLRKAEFGRGRKSDKYKRKRFEMVYKCKWVIGTDKCYDFGPAKDQKRTVELKTKAKTALSYKFYAYNFHNMKAQSFMERLITHIDEYHLSAYKLQNFKNRAIGSAFWIDLDALESVALSKGGASMSPREVLQMFVDTGWLLGRSKDAAGNPNGPNWKPVIPIQGTVMDEMKSFVEDMLFHLSMMERLTGYNDVSSGDPNPKLLTPGYEAAEMSTNHALFPLKFAEDELTKQLAADVLCRMQQGIRKGEVSGYAPYKGALGVNTLTFIKVSSDIALRDYGIMLQERTTDAQKQWVFQQLQQDIANGFLDTSDAAMILHTHNVKQGMMLLAFKVKKAKERVHQQELEKIEANNRGSAEATQVAHQLEMEKKQVEWQFELQKMNMELMASLKEKEMVILSNERIKMAELQAKLQIGEGSDNARVQASAIQAEAKVAAQQIDQQTKVISGTISGQAALDKQELANKKPAPKPKT
jgi:hypothetical protein